MFMPSMAREALICSQCSQEVVFSRLRLAYSASAGNANVTPPKGAGFASSSVSTTRLTAHRILPKPARTEGGNFSMRRALSLTPSLNGFASMAR